MANHSHISPNWQSKDILCTKEVINGNQFWNCVVCCFLLRKEYHYCPWFNSHGSFVCTGYSVVELLPVEPKSPMAGTAENIFIFLSFLVFWANSWSLDRLDSLDWCKHRSVWQCAHPDAQRPLQEGSTKREKQRHAEPAIATIPKPNCVILYYIYILTSYYTIILHTSYFQCSFRNHLCCSWGRVDGKKWVVRRGWLKLTQLNYTVYTKCILCVY